MRVKLDLDGVLLSLLPEWLSVYNDEYNDNLQPEDITHWDTHRFVKSRCGFDVYDLLDTTGLFLHAKPVEGAIRAVRRLQREGHEILIVTALPPGERVAYEKLRWLNYWLSEVPRDNIVFATRKELVQGDVLIDDAPHNIEKERETGGHGIIFDRPYNQEVEGPRLMDWSLDSLNWLIGYLRSVKRYV